MKIGVFIPIGNNGWLISTTSPQYMPSFALNRAVTLAAERHGLDFVLSMIKLRGFGGASEFWDHNLESFTLMAGLAAVTSRIQLFASAPGQMPICVYSRRCQPEMMLIPNRPFEIESIVTAMRAAKAGGRVSTAQVANSWMRLVTDASPAIRVNDSRL